MPAELLTRAELAARLGVTERTVTNWVQMGLPQRTRGKHVRYDWVAARSWWLDRIVKPAEKKPEGAERTAELKLRDLEVTVLLAELELAEKQGQMVSLDYADQQLTGMLGRLRAKLLNAPGKWAPSFVGLRTIAEAQTRFEQVVAEMMTSLSDTGEDPELDAEDEDADAPAGEGSVAA